jgi:hypothetical protein
MVGMRISHWESSASQQSAARESFEDTEDGG